MRLAIDPGHGGESTGAVGNGIVEKDWCLSFCRLLAARISVCELPIKTMLTRNSDIDVSLGRRGALTNDWHADLVLSVHVNAHPLDTIAGAMTFSWPGNDVGAAVSEVICRSVPEPLHRSAMCHFETTDDPTSSDVWLQRPRNVLKPHAATAVLFEVGYLSNESDAEALRDPIVQDGLVFAAIGGVLEAMQLQS